MSTADAACHLVTAVSLLQASLVLFLPISISDEPVCVRAWVYVCLCEFSMNIRSACASHFRVSSERWDGERMTSLPIYGCVGIPPHYSLLQCIPIPRTFGSYHLIAAGGGVCAARAHYLWLMEHCVPLCSNTLIHSQKRQWEMSESQFQFQCKETMMNMAELHVLVHVPMYNECIKWGCVWGGLCTHPQFHLPAGVRYPPMRSGMKCHCKVSTISQLSPTVSNTHICIKLFPFIECLSFYCISSSCLL